MIPLIPPTIQFAPPERPLDDDLLRVKDAWYSPAKTYEMWLDRYCLFSEKAPTFSSSAQTDAGE